VAITPAGALFDFLDEHAVPATPLAFAGKHHPTHGPAALQRRPSRDVLDRHFAADEIVTRYEPGRAKTWESMGRPHRLLGCYRLALHLEARGDVTLLTASLSYAPPTDAFGGLLARLVSAGYAKWCTTRVINMAVAWSERREFAAQRQFA